MMTSPDASAPGATTWRIVKERRFEAEAKSTRRRVRPVGAPLR
jgi:hypothetical protein